MSLLHALIIGLIQGLTEFLPVSSSAHLKIVKIVLGLESGENQVLFDLVCHLGTLTAVLYFLRHEILLLFREDRRKLLLIILATLPLIPAYFFLKPLREFTSQIHFLGPCLLITSLFLFLGEKIRVAQPVYKSVKREIRDVLWIGTFQSIALIPGISRSASTISCAQVLGWDIKRAVRFSFLLSIPTVIGGNMLELIKLLMLKQTMPSLSVSTCTMGFVSSLVTGTVMIRYAIQWLESGRLRPFAWYCFLIGLGVSAFFFFAP